MPLRADHEEADTRLVLHCLESQSKVVVVHDFDTDVVVLLLTHYTKFCEGLRLFLSMKNNQFLEVGGLIQEYSPEFRSSLILAHALTGCDAVSYLYGIGKGTVVKVLHAQYHLLQDITTIPNLTTTAKANMEIFFMSLWRLQHCQLGQVKV